MTTATLAPVTTDARALLVAAKAAKLAVARRPSLPVLGMVRLAADGGELTVSGTDLSSYVTCRIPASGSGALCVSPADLLAALPSTGPVELLIDGERLSVGGLTIAGIDADEFPPHLRDEVGDPIEVTGIGPAMRYASLAAADGGSRAILESVSMEDGCLVAADNYTIHVAPLAAKLSGVLDVGPARILAKLAPESVTVRIGPAVAEFTWPGVRVLGRLIDGHFPNWQQVRPARRGELTIDARALGAAVTKAAAVAKAGNNVLRLSYDEVMLTVRAKSGVSEAVLTVPATGVFESVALNAAYLLRALDRASGDVTLGTSGRFSPVTLHHPDGRYAIIMPVRTGEEI